MRKTSEEGIKQFFVLTILLVAMIAGFITGHVDLSKDIIIAMIAILTNNSIVKKED